LHHDLKLIWNFSQDIQEARAEVARYIDHYNHERPHQSLDYRTPHQAFLNPKPAA
jgi:transposase InsO family protein